MDGMGAADVGNAGLGKTEKSYLTLLDEITDRTGHFLNRHSRIDTVLVEEIDIIGAEPGQGTLHCHTDMLRPASSFGAELLSVLETKAKLGAVYPLAAPALERAAEQ